MIDELPLTTFDTIVYHCVDDLASIPRVAHRALRSAERRLAPRATAIFASTPALAARMRAYGATSVHLTPNVADIRHFSQALAPGAPPAELAAIPPPRAIYIGSLSAHKVDWQLLAGVAHTRPDWSFVIVGDSGGETRLEARKPFKHASNVYFLGHRPYAALPDYLRGANAALIPYRLTEHTDGVCPLKLWEYLAAGLHVVSTPLPAIQAAAAPVAIAATPEAFAAALDGWSDSTRISRRAAASGHDWNDLLDDVFRSLST